jgi:hypothetical protein
LKLLLDEHIWPGVAALVIQTIPGANVESIHEFLGGRLMNSDDIVILREAHRTGHTLVTFDVNTIPAVLHEMGTTEEAHSGVLFISAKSFAQNDHAGLARALAEIMHHEGESDWTHRVMFLRRGGSE